MSALDPQYVLRFASARHSLLQLAPVAMMRMRSCASYFSCVLPSDAFTLAAKSCDAPELSTYLRLMRTPDEDVLCALLFRDQPTEIFCEVHGDWDLRLALMLQAWKVQVSHASDQVFDALQNCQLHRLKNLLTVCPDLATDKLLCAALQKALKGPPSAMFMLKAVAHVCSSRASTYVASTNASLCDEGDAGPWYIYSHALMLLSSTTSQEAMDIKVEGVLRDLDSSANLSESNRKEEYAAFAFEALLTFPCSEEIAERALSVLVQTLGARTIKQLPSLHTERTVETATEALTVYQDSDFIRAACFKVLASCAGCEDEYLAEAVVLNGAVALAADVFMAESCSEVVRVQAMWLLARIAYRTSDWKTRVFATDCPDQCGWIVALFPIMYFLCMQMVSIASIRLSSFYMALPNCVGRGAGGGDGIC